MFCVFSHYDEAVKSLEQDVPLYSVFPSPLQQPAFGLSFPSTKTVQVITTTLHSFCMFLLWHKMLTVDPQESHVTSPEQVLIKTFMHHQEIYSCSTLQEIRWDHTNDSASLL